MPDTVLIVDDEASIREVLAESLAAAGYDATAAVSGEDALDRVAEAPAELYIIDLKMPGMSGLDFIRRIRPDQPDAQIVILTGYADVPTAVEALRLGAYDYLTKPVDLDRVLHTLRNAAERRRLLLENRDLMRRLQEANRLKAEFLNGMSHEVRTPLGHITGFTQILQDTLEDATGKQRQYLSNIQNAATGLLEMFENILRFSELKTQNVDLCPEEIDVRVLLEDAVDAVRSDAQRKGLSLDVDSDVDGPVRIDRANVSKALSLLLDNAVKFTNEGGITLSADSRATRHPAACETAGTPGGHEWLAVAVQDTGIGIAPEDRERIWNLFEQVDGALSRQYQGTGIGLPLARSLARLHGGTITVESEPGKGSTFTLLLPFLEPDVPD